MEITVALWFTSALSQCASSRPASSARARLWSLRPSETQEHAGAALPCGRADGGPHLAGVEQADGSRVALHSPSSVPQ